MKDIGIHFNNSNALTLCNTDDSVPSIIRDITCLLFLNSDYGDTYRPFKDGGIYKTLVTITEGGVTTIQSKLNTLAIALKNQLSSTYTGLESIVFDIETNKTSIVVSITATVDSESYESIIYSKET